MSHSRSPLRAWIRTYVIALGIALPVVVGSVVGVNAFYEREVASIPRVRVEVEENTDPGEPANFLLIGSDSRAFVDDPAEEEAFGDPAIQTGQLSDTLMVVHVDPEAKTGLLVSFPRDLLVEIPGVGRSKINAAFNNGGPQRVIDTLATYFNIPIHHYLEVGFASFEGIVDAVGGVPVYFPAAARDGVTGFEIGTYFGWLPGCHELNGGAALAYVRARKYEQLIDGEWVEDPRADIGRIERQQAFMRRLASEAVSTALANPLKARTIADRSLAKLKADEALARSDVDKLIQAFRRVDPNDPNSIEMITVPWETGPSYNGQDVLYLNEEEAEPLFQRLRTFAPVTAPEGPAPSEVRVRVFNGSGVNQAAARTLAALEEHSFQSGGTGNNPGGNVARTQVRYRPGSEAEAEVVRSYLGGVGELVADDSIVEADVLLVIGRDFEQVTPPGGAAATPTTTAPAATTPPSSAGDAPGGTDDSRGEPAASPETSC